MAFFTVRSTEKASAFLYLMREVLGVDGATPAPEASAAPVGGKKRKQSSASGGGSGRVKELTVVFAATRHHCEYLVELLTGAGVVSRAPPPQPSASRARPPLSLAAVARATLLQPCCTIYGTMDQEARTANLERFRNRRIPVRLRPAAAVR